MDNKENLIQQLVSASYLIQKEAEKLNELCNLETLNFSEIEKTLRDLDSYKETMNYYFKLIKTSTNEEK